MAIALAASLTGLYGPQRAAAAAPAPGSPVPQSAPMGPAVPAQSQAKAEPTNDATYAHDANGRVTAMFDGSGAGSKLNYDASGNVTDVTPLPADSLAIAQVSPPRAEPGGKVTIYGTNFGTGVSVSFGGTTATPSDVSANQIAVTVPAGADSGSVTVTRGGDSATWNGFRVITRTPPAISDIDQQIVAVGDTVAVSGSGFDPDHTRDIASVNGTKAAVSAATASRLTVRTPPYPVFGHVKITTAGGSDQSAGDVIVPPDPYTPADVGWAGRLTSGTVTSVSLPNPQQIALALFDIAPGQRGLVNLSGGTFPGCYELHVRGPDQRGVVVSETTCGDGTWELPDNLPAGTYEIEIDPSDADIGSIQVLATAFTDPTASVTVDGAPASVTSTAPGQRPRFTFDGTAGQRVFTKIGTTAPGFYAARLVAPDGSTVASDTFLQNAAFLDTVALPTTGTYTVVIDPDGVTVGTYTVTVNSATDQAATAAVDGASGSVALTKPGQNGTITFTGTAGQRVFTRLAYASNVAACNLSIALYAPDGIKLASDTCSFGTSDFFDTLALPADGTYKILIDPQGAATVTATATLNTAPDVTAGTSIDGTAGSVALTKPGQNGTITFTGTAGQRVFTRLAYASNVAACNLTIALYAPDGTRLANDTCSTGTSDFFDTLALPADGTYKILIDPQGAATVTATATLNTAPDVTAGTSIDGTAATVALTKPGQNGTVTFTGTAGQPVFTRFGYASSVAACNLTIALYAPDGTRLANDTCSTGTSDSLDTTTLPADGTYKVVVDPQGATTVTATVTVTSAEAVTATTSVDGTAANVALTKPGQNGTVTFTGTAGQRVFTRFGYASSVAACNLTIALYAPDGTRLANDTCSTGTSDFFDTLSLPVNGTYRVVVDPQGASTLTATVAVAGVPADAAATAVIDGGAATLDITKAGQNGTATFTATAGQRVVTQFTYSPSMAACNLTIALFAPDGTRLANDTCSTGTSDSFSAVTLPAAGSYRVVVDPQGTTTLTATVTVKTAPAAPSRTTPAATADPRQVAQHKALARLKHGPAKWSHVAGRPASGASTLTGTVLTTSGSPLAGVTVRIDRRTARTDAAGRFRLTALPQGTRVLRMDGRTASSAAQKYGVFDVQVRLKSGANALPYTPYLPVLDSAHEIDIASPTTREVVVTNPGIPGLEVHIPAGVTIEDADGKPVHRIGITPIPVNRTPIPMPQGVQVPVYFTVQPAGGYLEGGAARVVYPNYLHATAGQRINFWHYEKDGEGWEVYGSGQVDKAAKQVVPAAGTRLYDFDGAMINGPGNPEPQASWWKRLLNFAGDPVDLSTGLFNFTQTDLAVSDVMPLTVVRGYNSGDTTSRAMGVGGTDLYNMYLTSRHQYQEADLNLPSGAQVHYARISPGDDFCTGVFEARTTSPDYYKSRFSYVGTCNQGTWHLKLRDGRVFVFGDEAPLQAFQDRYGNTVQIIRKFKNAFGSYIGPVTDVRSPNGFWLAYTYDASDRVSKIEDNAGRSVSYTYDAAGHLSTVTDADGHVTTYGYDGAGRMATVTDPRGIQYLSNSYDANGRIHTQTVAGEGTYTFDYTLDGSTVTATKVTQPDGTVRKAGFDSEGYLHTDVYAADSPNERAVTISRDPDSDLPTKLEDGFGRTVTSEYDANGNSTTNTVSAGDGSMSGSATYNGTSFGLPDSVTDPNGHTTRLEYDAGGSPKKVTDALGHTWQGTYDAQGNLRTATTQLGHQTTYTYADGALTSVTDALGRTTRFVRDAANRVVETIAPDGTSTTTKYDDANLITETIDGEGDSTTYTYDAGGNVAVVTDPRGHPTTFDYDNADRVQRRTDPLGHADTYTYDPAGRPATHTDRRGQTTEFRYDELGRTTFAGYGKNGDSYESTLTYDYDDSGRLKSVDDSTPGAGTVSYSYDDLDRLTMESGAAGSVDYDYDPGGRLKTVTPSGRPAVGYTYDNADRLMTITRGALSVGYGYDADDRLTSKTLPGGVTTTYGYDDADQLASIAYDQGTDHVGDIGYDYNAVGERTSVHGSLFKTQLPAAETGNTYDAGNRLTAAGGATLTYDLAGNLTSDGTHGYAWNARGQLTSVTDAAGTSALAYDPVGRLSSTSVGGTTTGFRYDGDQLIGQSGSGGQSVSYLNGPGRDEVLARIDGSGAVQSYLQDALGSTLALTDDTGAVTTTYAYGLFGDTTSSTPDDSNPVRWTGRVAAPALPAGLQDNRARAYSPELHRFISEDPVGFAGGDLNFYAYAAGDPVDVSDPDGTCPQCVVPAAACVIGGVVNDIGGWLAGRKHSFGDFAWGAVKGCVGGALLVVPGVGEEEAAIAAAARLGREGEAAAGIVKNTERIASATGAAKYRVPDILDHVNKIIGDVKNVKELKMTSQLRDFLAYAQQNGYKFEIIVRQNTQIVGRELNDLVNRGIITIIRKL